jgi:hypothetical protein
MGVPILVHVSAGLIGLVAGYLALGVAKGSALHKRSGLVFVYTMLVLSLTGAAMAAVGLTSPSPKPGLEATVLMGLMTAYLVVTALTTVRPPGVWSRRLDRMGVPLIASIGVAHLTLGTLAVTNPDNHQFAILTVVEFSFGAIALLAAWSDLRIIRTVPLTGGRRIARHLWRMTLALWIAALSFFPRLNRFFPKSMQPLMSIPMLLVLLALIYWMWRVRYRNSLRGLIGVATGGGVAPTSSSAAP